MKHIDTIAKISLYFTNIFLLFVCIFLVFFAVSLITGGGPKFTENLSEQSSSNTARSSSSPNAVETGLSDAVDHFGKQLSIFGNKLNITTQYVEKTATYAGSTIAQQTARIALFVVKGLASLIIYSGIITARITFFIVKTVAMTSKNVVMFVLNANIKVYGFAFGTPYRAVTSAFDEPIITKFVSPSEQITKVPIIDPYSPEIENAITTLAEEEVVEPNVKAANTESPRVRWPVNGNITTQFGVPHWPYQPVHTGLDISNNTPAGVTPVMAFRAGRVQTVVVSRYGLGNHVIVDHGSGITSVYAHLDSIAVVEGQPVTTETELGRQGTTGVSTGVHLHFEIRINGQATNPLPFLQS